MCLIWLPNNNWSSLKSYTYKQHKMDLADSIYTFMCLYTYVYITIVKRENLNFRSSKWRNPGKARVTV